MRWGLLVAIGAVVFAVAGLCQKFEGARFHRSNCCGNIAVAGQEDNRESNVGFGKFLLKIKPA